MRKILLLTLIFSLLLPCASAPAAGNEWTCPSCGRTGNIRRFCGECGTENPVTARITDLTSADQINAGDQVLFGRYEQDNNPDNGAEDIRWFVLDKVNNYVLLLSQYGLDAVPYHNGWHYLIWTKCSLFSWLNSSFYTSAFSEAEQALVYPVQFDASGLSKKYLSSRDRSKAENYVFLLSEMDVKEYLSSISRIRCRPSAYAVAAGAYTEIQEHAVNGMWWLRTWNSTDETNEPLKHPGPKVIDPSGALTYSGAKNDYVLVRPACWVRISD